MSAANQVYLLDAGNTHLKLALVQNGVIQLVERFTLDTFSFSNLDRNIPFACSSVIGQHLLEKVRAYFISVFEITTMVQLPFSMAYRSPQTLGLDRLCNAAALSVQNMGQPRLAIDLGTCIKFDFLDATNRYIGGSIGPGLQMRSKAMARFTAQLPEVAALPTQQLIGTNSTESLEIGTYLGWQKEIEGILATYKQAYPDVLVFLTGGDARHFDIGQKNGIFVHENLTLEGIFALYQANA